MPASAVVRRLRRDVPTFELLMADHDGARRGLPADPPGDRVHPTGRRGHRVPPSATSAPSRHEPHLIVALRSLHTRHRVVLP
jgi:hypothetical protein